jgi:hypothetical protein
MKAVKSKYNPAFHVIYDLANVLVIALYFGRICQHATPVRNLTCMILHAWQAQKHFYYKSQEHTVYT